MCSDFRGCVTLAQRARTTAQDALAKRERRVLSPHDSHQPHPHPVACVLRARPSSNTSWLPAAWFAGGDARRRSRRRDGAGCSSPRSAQAGDWRWPVDGESSRSTETGRTRTPPASTAARHSRRRSARPFARPRLGRSGTQARSAHRRTVSIRTRTAVYDTRTAPVRDRRQARRRCLRGRPDRRRRHYGVRSASDPHLHSGVASPDRPMATSTRSGSWPRGSLSPRGLSGCARADAETTEATPAEAVPAPGEPAPAEAATPVGERSRPRSGGRRGRGAPEKPRG